jgi:hypothetical protein
MLERQPVPDEEWQKFSSQNEAGVEAARGKIHADNKRKQAEFLEEVKHLQPTAQDLRNEELLTRVEAGELTYEELDQQVLKNYQETPASERNWRRDAGFYQLPEHDQHRELIEEGIRDTQALSETLRVAVSDPEKSRRLRMALTDILNELQNEPGR